VCVDAVEAEVRNAEPGAFYLVLTHRHDLDLRITEAILRRGDFGFVGLIGSRTKRQRFVHHFEARGIAADAIERMTCPIGLPGINGKEPEVIAAAVVAQLLQVAQARAGGGTR
jgi:xanthine dehydrogenase accessory factor